MLTPPAPAGVAENNSSPVEEFNEILFWTRLLAIWMLCPQPCTKIPPPPWELSVMPRPSMLDGLHWKLPGNGLCAVVVLAPQLLAVRSVVPAGKVPAVAGSIPNGSDPAGNCTPFDNTVMAAPSSAPMRLGSCNSSAMLPF